MDRADQESSTTSELVILVFSKWHLEDFTQSGISASIIAALKQLAPGEYDVSPLSSRSLRWGKVFEIKYRPHQPNMRLPDCKSIAQSRVLLQLQKSCKVELVIQPRHLYDLHRQPGLAVFDMDSTLIQQEVIDELARAVGKYDQVSAITEAAMRGEAPYTDFEASLRARVALLNGVNTTIWEKLKAEIITFTPGAHELIHFLKERGWKTAVLSGGFTPLANWVKDTLKLDYAHANHLVVDQDLHILTGELVPGAPIVHAQRKRELLLQLAAENGIPVERTIAVGDGSNDLLMMEAAGLGIAFNAKPKVQQAAPVRLNSETLLDVAHILGYASDEINHPIP